MKLEDEKKKYDEVWGTGKYHQSPANSWVIDKILALEPLGKVLDIGCGNGYAVAELLERKVDAHGTDITKAAWKTKSAVNPSFHIPEEKLTEAPASNTPFKNAEFDTTYSVTVLEHIPPEEVSAVIKEILRITSNKTIHYINTEFEQQQFGHDLHLTVKPLEWWQEQFDKYNFKKISVILGDSNL